MKIIYIALMLLFIVSVTPIQITILCDADMDCPSGSSLSLISGNMTYSFCASSACSSGNQMTVNAIPCSSDFIGNSCDSGICWYADAFSACISQTQSCNPFILDAFLKCEDCPASTPCSSQKCINYNESQEICPTVQMPECAFERIDTTFSQCTEDSFGFPCACCADTIITGANGISGGCVDQTDEWYSTYLYDIVNSESTQPCGNGTRQSPIDLDPALAKHCLTTDFNFVQFPCQELWFDGGYQIDAVGAAYVLIDSKVDGMHYKTIAEASHFEFRSPSEHTIKGKSFDLQMQIISTSLDQSLWAGIIDNINIETLTPYKKEELWEKFVNNQEGVMPENTVISYLFEVDDANADDKMIVDDSGMVNLNNLLSCTTDAYFYRYEGSLTSSPCTGEVQWLVSRRPIKINSAELDRIKAVGLIRRQSRETQDLDGRTIRLTGTPCSKTEMI